MQPVVGSIDGQPVEGTGDADEPESERDEPAAAQERTGSGRSAREQEPAAERHVNEVVEHAHLKHAELLCAGVPAGEAQLPDVCRQPRDEARDPDERRRGSGNRRNELNRITRPQRPRGKTTTPSSSAYKTAPGSN